MSGLKLWPRALLILTVFTWQVRAEQGQVKTFDQFWPETDVYVKLNDFSRLFFLWAGTRTSEDRYTDGQAGVHVDLFLPPFWFKDRVARHSDMAKNKFLTVRLGYLYGATPKDSTNPFTEHTPTAETNSRFFIQRLLLTNRNRFDFRFKNGEFAPRYRARLKVERTFHAGRFAVTPYAHAEAFYDWRFREFHRFRFCAGGEWEITRRVVLESYYLRQVDSKSAERTEDIAGLALQLYIR